MVNDQEMEIVQIRTPQGEDKYQENKIFINHQTNYENKSKNFRSCINGNSINT